MALTDEEAAQLAALQAKQAETPETTEVALVQTIGEVAETVAEVVAEQVGAAHEQATAVVLANAEQQVHSAESDANMQRIENEHLQRSVIRAEESQETERAEIYAEAAPTVVEVPVVVDDVEALSVDDDGNLIVEPTTVEQPEGAESSAGRKGWRYHLLGTHGRAR